MKRCPYCAERIQDAAVVCRYCGSKLPAGPPEVRASATQRPSAGVSILFALLLLVTFYGFAFVIGYVASSATNDYSAVRGIVAVYQLLATIFLIRWAGYGGDSKGRGFWWGLGLYILAQIPVVGWLVYYMAGQGIARRLREGGGKTLVVVLAALALAAILGSLCLVTGMLPLAMGYDATATPSPPYSPPSKAFATRTPRLTPLDLRAPQGCMPWDQVSKSFVGRSLCVTGTIAKRNEFCGDEWSPCVFIYRFTNTDPTAFLFNTDRWWGTPMIEIGKCVTVTGQVKINGPAIYMENPDVSYC